MTAHEPTAERIDPNIDTMALSLWDAGLIRPESVGHLVIEHLITEQPEALAASLPVEVMLAALVDRGALAELPRRGDLPGWRGFTGWVAP